MKLADFATPIMAKNRFVKAGFGGFAGAGKSRTATDFCIGAYKDLGYTKPLLIIDNEQGSRFLIPLFQKAGITAISKDTVHLDDVLQAMAFLRDGEIDMLFVDSLTKVWYQYVRDYRSKNRRVFMELNDWGKLIPAWQEAFSDRFVEAQGSIIFTGRGGYEYEKEDDEIDEATGKRKKGGFVRSGVKMKLAGETPFEPDLNVWMQLEQEVGQDGRVSQWREAQIMKDRSGLIDGKTFKNPTYDEFRPFVQYLTHVQVGNVAGSSSTTNLAPAESYESADRRTKREIALEKIQANFVKRGVSSQSKEGKSTIVTELEKHFNTTSWKELEVMQFDRFMVGFDSFLKSNEPQQAEPA